MKKDHNAQPSQSDSSQESHIREMSEEASRLRKASQHSSAERKDNIKEGLQETSNSQQPTHYNKQFTP